MVKVFIDCKSPLLKSALDIFLKDYATNIAAAEAVISDGYIKTEKPLLIIGNQKSDHIKKPFTKASLMLVLDKFRQQNELSSSIDEINGTLGEDRVDIEKEIMNLTNNFANELARLLKAKYEH